MTNQKRGSAKKSVVDVSKWRDSVDQNLTGINKWGKSVDKNISSLNKWSKGVDIKFTSLNKWSKGVDKWQKNADKRFEKIESLLNRVALTSSNNSVDLKKVQEKLSEFDVLKEMMRNLAISQDVMIGKLDKRNQEQVFMGHRLERVESDVNKIKPRVGLA